MSLAFTEAVQSSSSAFSASRPPAKGLCLFQFPHRLQGRHCTARSGETPPLDGKLRLWMENSAFGRVFLFLHVRFTDEYGGAEMDAGII